MGLKGKVIGETEIKTGGDVFHELYKRKPHQFPVLVPDKVQGFSLIDGELGTVGSVICYNYSNDGSKMAAKVIIEEIDDKKLSMSHKTIEGDLMELYKIFNLTQRIEKKGEVNIFTWIFEYEKLNEDVPPPSTMMKFMLDIVKDADVRLLHQARDSLILKCA